MQLGLVLDHRSVNMVTSVALSDHLGGFVGFEHVGLVTPLGKPSVPNIFGSSINAYAFEVIGNPASVVPTCVLF